jgi:hypothetical protein
LRDDRLRWLPFLALVILLPLPGQAALTRVGAPLLIADGLSCSSIIDLGVIANPQGDFEVVWVDDFDFVVKGQRFARDLQPSGPPQTLLPLHGGLNTFDLVGTWAGLYELVMNVADFGDNPSDPLASYRVQLDADGEPLAPPVRVKPPRFIALAPAADGDSLQFRFEPPIFGPFSCQSRGLLARRIDGEGHPQSVESRVNRHASPWAGAYLAVDRLPDDTFVAAYSTCQKFLGLVARRLNAVGAPVGKPFNLQLPGRVGNFAGGNLVIAAHGAGFAVAAMVSSLRAGATGAYTEAVLGKQIFGPTRITAPTGIGGVIDLAAAPDGGYLLLFQGVSSPPQHFVLFVQELDEHGVPQGPPQPITEPDENGLDGAITSLPDSRWLVITRANSGDPDHCVERLVGTILARS